MRTRFTGRLRVAAATGALMSLACGTAALAQPGQGEDGWYVRLGALGLVTPEYEGSDHYKIQPVPDIEITYNNRFFLSRQGLGANLIATDDLTVGAAVAFDGGRKSSKDKALHGYRNVGDTAIGRVFAEYTIDRLMLSVDVATDLLGDGHKGTEATLSATWMFNPVGQTMVMVGPSLTWASDDYMNSYFSTTADRLRPTGPTELVLPGSRTGYKAEAGFKNAGLTAILIHPLDDNWSVMGIAGYSRMLGNAADSPFVKDNGSRDQLMGGLGIAYTF
ncbi:MipA/OmpV family protein [Niveispirillum sp. KHB5.9]|uniref:MipA/OmpV family protein n=1 Tax=Niveispirillum sp. KHB5.9 TaxID=3400269 RepID=UPI003A8C2E81